jgi:hypothetical protein
VTPAVAWGTLGSLARRRRKVAAKSARGACGRQRGSKLVVSVRTFDACDRDRTFYWVCELTLGTALI